ncbi:MAG: hypothetical protein FWG50_00085 [Kiritimatiellaeota bacterium]|nr:hypothetical protein [Kiritimatiellota bacterium]
MRTMTQNVLLAACALLVAGILAQEAPKGVERAWAEMPSEVKAGIPKLVLVRRKGGYGLNGTNGTMFSRRTGRGSTIEVFDPQNVGAPPQVIFATDEGFVWDLDVSWDGTKILFTHKTAVNEPFHLWEVGVDGTGLRQVTDGRWHDFNGVYYPDGRIVFASSRVESYSYCQDFLASAIYVCEADGADIRRIDFTTLCSMKPAVMDDGSILFTRWEYQDKNIFMWQGLWTILPDGRQLQLYYGNTINVPNARYGGRPVPGTGDVLLTMAAHHFPPVADIALLNRAAGIEDTNALRKVTFETPYSIAVGKDFMHAVWGPGDQYFPFSVTDPCPLADGLFLASFGDKDTKAFRLCACLYDGTRYTVEGAGANVFSATPLRPRPLPRTIVRTAAPQQPGEGTFYVQDVYRGLEEQGVARGQVASLRIMRPLPKSQNTEGPRFYDHYPLIGYGTYYVKEILGEVPVDASGSAYFTVPSNCELYFIALDKDGKEVQRMGSVTQITTGENASCVGCHEPRMSSPPAAAKNDPRAGRAPDPVTPPPWGAGPVDYATLVQPVLDRHCARCHAGPTPPKFLDLSGGKTRFFSQSYETLCERKLITYYYINPGPTGVFPALKTGSMTSKLTRILEGKHNDIDVPPADRRRIYAWIDSNVLYYPTFEMSRPYTRGGRDAWYFVPGDKRGRPQPEPWFAAFDTAYAAACATCHGPLAPEDASDNWGQNIIPLNRKHQWLNLTTPQDSRALTAHLAKDAGGYGIPGTQKNSDEKYLIATKDDPVYKALLDALTQGKAALEKRPRMDMPGATPVLQARDFGRTF